ncbi:hypothetical protein HY414_02430 [Candidatus Kaiserbacteria bacterium]|nr:hypothetical protein [Candidatus Kaiserbacteria bacterium]
MWWSQDRHTSLFAKAALEVAKCEEAPAGVFGVFVTGNSVFMGSEDPFA